MRRQHFAVVLVLGLLLLSAAPGIAQPFGQILNLAAGNQFVEIPSDPALTPTTAITIEFLSHSAGSAACDNLIGKGFLTSYWIGNCNGTLRSYLAGNSSQRNGGTIAPGEYTHHIAVTYDGARRRHYIDGELVGSFAQTGPLPVTSNPLRFGGDVNYSGHSPNGYIDEVRIWSVARTQAQIRELMATSLNSSQPGLVSVWHLNGNGNDSIGAHNGGAPQGGATYGPYLSPGGSCSPGSNVACFFSGRFTVVSSYQVFSGPDGQGVVTLTPNVGVATVVPGASDSSALFWFFSADNWELLAKGVNACTPPFNSWWIFGAATTNVHHRFYVIDNDTGIQRIYWSFYGPPAPAVTDTQAFACP